MPPISFINICNHESQIKKAPHTSNVTKIMLPEEPQYHVILPALNLALISIFTHYIYILVLLSNYQDYTIQFCFLYAKAKPLRK